MDLHCQNYEDDSVEKYLESSEARKRKINDMPYAKKRIQTKDFAAKKRSTGRQVVQPFHCHRNVLEKELSRLNVLRETALKDMPLPVKPLLIILKMPQVNLALQHMDEHLTFPKMRNRFSIWKVVTVQLRDLRRAKRRRACILIQKIVRAKIARKRVRRLTQIRKEKLAQMAHMSAVIMGTNVRRFLARKFVQKVRAVQLKARNERWRNVILFQAVVRGYIARGIRKDKARIALLAALKAWAEGNINDLLNRPELRDERSQSLLLVAMQLASLPSRPLKRLPDVEVCNLYIQAISKKRKELDAFHRIKKAAYMARQHDRMKMSLEDKWGVFRERFDAVLKAVVERDYAAKQDLRRRIEEEKWKHQLFASNKNILEVFEVEKLLERKERDEMFRAELRQRRMDQKIANAKSTSKNLNWEIMKWEDGMGLKYYSMLKEEKEKKDKLAVEVYKVKQTKLIKDEELRAEAQLHARKKRSKFDPHLVEKVVEKAVPLPPPAFRNPFQFQRKDAKRLRVLDEFKGRVQKHHEEETTCTKVVKWWQEADVQKEPVNHNSLLTQEEKIHLIFRPVKLVLVFPIKVIDLCKSSLNMVSEVLTDSSAATTSSSGNVAKPKIKKRVKPDHYSPMIVSAWYGMDEKCEMLRTKLKSLRIIKDMRVAYFRRLAMSLAKFEAYYAVIVGLRNVIRNTKYPTRTLRKEKLAEVEVMERKLPLLREQILTEGRILVDTVVYNYMGYLDLFDIASAKSDGYLFHVPLKEDEVVKTEVIEKTDETVKVEKKKESRLYNSQPAVNLTNILKTGTPPKKKRRPSKHVNNHQGKGEVFSLDFQYHFKTSAENPAVVVNNPMHFLAPDEQSLDGIDVSFLAAANKELDDKEKQDEVKPMVNKTSKAAFPRRESLQQKRKSSVNMKLKSMKSKESASVQKALTLSVSDADLGATVVEYNDSDDSPTKSRKGSPLRTSMYSNKQAMVLGWHIPPHDKYVKNDTFVKNAATDYDFVKWGHQLKDWYANIVSIWFSNRDERWKEKNFNLCLTYLHRFRYTCQDTSSSPSEHSAKRDSYTQQPKGEVDTKSDPYTIDDKDIYLTSLVHDADVYDLLDIILSRADMFVQIYDPDTQQLFTRKIDACHGDRLFGRHPGSMTARHALKHGLSYVNTNADTPYDMEIPSADKPNSRPGSRGGHAKPISRPPSRPSSGHAHVEEIHSSSSNQGLPPRTGRSKPGTATRLDSATGSRIATGVPSRAVGHRTGSPGLGAHRTGSPGLGAHRTGSPGLGAHRTGSPGQPSTAVSPGSPLSPHVDAASPAKYADEECIYNCAGVTHQLLFKHFELFTAKEFSDWDVASRVVELCQLYHEDHSITDVSESENKTLYNAISFEASAEQSCAIVSKSAKVVQRNTSVTIDMNQLTMYEYRAMDCERNELSDLLEELIRKKCIFVEKSHKLPPPAVAAPVPPKAAQCTAGTGKKATVAGKAHGASKQVAGGKKRNHSQEKPFAKPKPKAAIVYINPYRMQLKFDLQTLCPSVFMSVDKTLDEWKCVIPSWLQPGHHWGTPAGPEPFWRRLFLEAHFNLGGKGSTKYSKMHALNKSIDTIARKFVANLYLKVLADKKRWEKVVFDEIQKQDRHMMIYEDARSIALEKDEEAKALRKEANRGVMGLVHAMGRGLNALRSCIPSASAKIATECRDLVWWELALQKQPPRQWIDWELIDEEAAACRLDPIFLTADDHEEIIAEAKEHPIYANSLISHDFPASWIIAQYTDDSKDKGPFEEDDALFHDENEENIMTTRMIRNKDKIPIKTPSLFTASGYRPQPRETWVCGGYEGIAIGYRLVEDALKYPRGVAQFNSRYINLAETDANGTPLDCLNLVQRTARCGFLSRPLCDNDRKAFAYFITDKGRYLGSDLVVRRLQCDVVDSAPRLGDFRRQLWRETVERRYHLDIYESVVKIQCLFRYWKARRQSSKLAFEIKKKLEEKEEHMAQFQKVKVRGSSQSQGTRSLRRSFAEDFRNKQQMTDMFKKIAASEEHSDEQISSRRRRAVSVMPSLFESSPIMAIFGENSSKNKNLSSLYSRNDFDGMLSMPRVKSQSYG